MKYIIFLALILFSTRLSAQGLFEDAIEDSPGGQNDTTSELNVFFRGATEFIQQRCVRLIT